MDGDAARGNPRGNVAADCDANMTDNVNAANESIRESLDLLDDEFGGVESLQNPSVSLVADIYGDPIYDVTPLRCPVGVSDMGCDSNEPQRGPQFDSTPIHGACMMEISPLNSPLAAPMQHLFIRKHRLNL